MVLRVMNWKRRRKVPDVERQIDFYDGGEHINADGNPDLSFHGVLGSAVEMLDAQILLYPFEKQFHSPTLFVERGDHGGGECEVVGQENKTQPCFWIPERDAP